VLLGLLAGPFLACKGRLAGDDLAHLFLDDRQIIGGKWRVALKIVIKPMLDCGADGRLRVGPECLNGLGQNMGEVMADQLQCTRIIARHQFQRGPIGQGRGQIAHLAIDERSHCALGEAWADGNCQIGGSAGRIKRAGCAIGQANGDHFEVFLSQGRVPDRSRCLPKGCSGQGARASAMSRAAVHGSLAPRWHRQNRWAETDSHVPAKVIAIRDSRALAGSAARRQKHRSGRA